MVSRRLDDGTVLVNMSTNRIFELNRTGARFWELLDDGSSEAEIVARLGEEFDVSEEQLRQEIRSLVDSLMNEGLISRDTPGG